MNRRLWLMYNDDHVPANKVYVFHHSGRFVYPTCGTACKRRMPGGKGLESLMQDYNMTQVQRKVTTDESLWKQVKHIGAVPKV